MDVGKRFRDLRGHRGLTQSDVAKGIGIRQPSLSQIESGDTGALAADTLIAAARFFNVDADWLYTGHGSPERLRPMTDDELRVLSLYRALAPAHRKSWLAAGSALLAHQEPGSAAA